MKWIYGTGKYFEQMVGNYKSGKKQKSKEELKKQQEDICEE